MLSIRTGTNIIRRLLAVRAGRCIIAGMKRILTVSEMASLGGKARAKKLSKEELSQQARKAVNVRWDRLRRKKQAGKKAG
jgi:hypothetical protein